MTRDRLVTRRHMISRHSDFIQNGAETESEFESRRISLIIDLIRDDESGSSLMNLMNLIVTNRDCVSNSASQQLPVLITAAALQLMIVTPQ